MALGQGTVPALIFLTLASVNCSSEKNKCGTVPWPVPAQPEWLLSVYPDGFQAKISAIE